MAVTDALPMPLVGTGTGADDALRSVRAAGDAVIAAKRTRSVALIECAHAELQDAVDAARRLEVEWGQIGSALGIARGNAYQRFRTKPSSKTFPPRRGGIRAVPRSA